MRKSNKNAITVYEYDTVGISDKCKYKITSDQLNILQQFSGDATVPYFGLINEGVKFCQFVGVLQVGKLTIEVLPKVDRGSESEKDCWKKILIDMLRKVGGFEVSPSEETSLKIKRNNILDIYIESFLVHVEKLMHQGLIKKYRKEEANSTSLKGKIVFSKHITKNIIHKELFFVKYTVYDQSHLLNKILYKTLVLIKGINTNQVLHSKVATLLLNFPEMLDIKVSESLFDSIVFDRKSESYRPAILVSRLLLLNYHPDINKGKNHVLALMFDMNSLWEKFVLVSLRKHFKEGKVEKQFPKPYWKLHGKRVVNLKPDIVLMKDGIKYVLDTKWKLPNNNKPSHGDLQQMYAYTKYFESAHTILCYPGKDYDFINGYFFSETDGKNKYPCSVLRIAVDVEKPIYDWQEEIYKTINDRLMVLGS